MYTCNPKNLKGGVPFDIVKRFIIRHQKDIVRLEKLRRYYIGEHEILNRKKDDSVLSNNRVICNHAKYITDMATGYMVGNPVSYNGEGIKDLQDWYQKADVATQDMDLGKDASIYGRAFELAYMSSDNVPVCKLANLCPLTTFMVYDDTVEHKELFAVYYFPVFGNDGKSEGYKCSVYDDKFEYQYLLTTDFECSKEPKSVEHSFRMVPVTEIYNNEECQSDFEPVLSLIDAYNLLQSERINDKEQFVDAILLLINASLGDSPEEESQSLNALKKQRALNLPENSDARWLTRTFDETSVEILRKSIEQDIHKFSNVPCMTDENFVGNLSGIAMRYKLLGFEQITRIKERYFSEGLKRRMRLFLNIMNATGKQTFDPDKVEITFTRNLPVNETEIASMVTQLSGQVPASILLSQLPFVKDSEKAIEELNREKDDAVKRQQLNFGYTSPEADNEQKE